MAATSSAYSNMETYFSLIHHADGCILMSPFDGEPERDFDTSPARIAALKGFLRGGDAEVEVVETYAAGDLVLLAVVERQHDEIGGLPEQGWSLRVTWVFRRKGTVWELVHRHADALVHPITLALISDRARGYRRKL